MMMMMTKVLGLGLATMIAGGCYAGVEDTGGDGLQDRWGKRCYYSYDNDASATFKADSDDSRRSGAQADGAYQLTVKADAVAADPEKMQEVFDVMRFQAAANATFHLQNSCAGAGENMPPEAQQQAHHQMLKACMPVCHERGFEVDEDSVLCETECKVDEHGTVTCFGALPPGMEEQLNQPWWGQEPWVAQSEDGRVIVVTPPRLQENANAEPVWVADVTVHGFCLCACR